MDIKLVNIQMDAGESAKSLDRPGLQAALKMLKAELAADRRAAAE